MTDLVNRNQAIFDAIVAATSYDADGIIVNVKKFIETFNSHRDRALCTSINLPSANDRPGESRNDGSTPSGGAMTRDNFEKITAIEDVKTGNVRIELRYLGFTVVAKRYDGAIAEQCISYLEADQSRYPVALFEAAIKVAKEKLHERQGDGCSHA